MLFGMFLHNEIKGLLTVSRFCWFTVRDLLIATCFIVGKTFENGETFPVPKKQKLTNTKCGSRHAAHVAKALRWRVKQYIKMPYKE